MAVLGLSVTTFASDPEDQGSNPTVIRDSGFEVCQYKVMLYWHSFEKQIHNLP